MLGHAFELIIFLANWSSAANDTGARDWGAQ